MKSRMEKYREETEDKMFTKREQRNQQLYRNVSKAELDDFDVYNNVSVLGKNSKNIDISQVKYMLDRKYHVEPKKKIVKDDVLSDSPEISLDETREYDLTQILNKVKSDKEVNYEEDRLKRVHNTQYDILKNLDLDSEDDNATDDLDEGEQELVELINTVNAKEKIEKELEELAETDSDLDPLDILSDLRGDDDSTRVMGALELDKEKEKNVKKDVAKALSEIVDSENCTKHTINDLKELDKIMDGKEKKSSTKKAKEKESVEEEYFTTSTQFNMADFDDFSDLKEGSDFIRVLIKIVAFIVVVIFVAGCVIFAKKFF